MIDSLLEKLRQNYQILKIGLFWLISLLLICSITWIWQGCRKDSEWEKKIINSQSVVIGHTHDSVAVQQDTYTGSVHVSSAPVDHQTIKKIAYLTKNVDSLHLIVNGLVIENDELRQELELAYSPKYIPIESEKIGKFLITYYPKTDSASYVYTEPQRYNYIDTVFSEKLVPIGRPWWEVPAIIIGSLGAGYLVHDLIKP